MSRTETHNCDLTCSVKFMVVAMNCLRLEAVFDYCLLSASVMGLPCCIIVAPFFASLSAISLPLISQWAGTHCNTTLLFPKTLCNILLRCGSLWL